MWRSVPTYDELAAKLGETRARGLVDALLSACVADMAAHLALLNKQEQLEAAVKHLYDVTPDRELVTKRLDEFLRYA